MRDDLGARPVDRLRAIVEVERTVLGQHDAGSLLHRLREPSRAFRQEAGLRIDQLETLRHAFDFGAWLERTGCTGESAGHVEELLGDRVRDGRLTLDKLAIRAVKGR